MISMDVWTAMLLAFCRIGSFLYFLPVFSGKSVPAMVKVTFGLALSISVADKINIAEIETLLELIAYAVTQVLIGVALAKIVEFFLSIPKMAGHIIDLDLGLAQASLLDYNAGSQSTLVSTLLDIFFVAIFIALGGLDYLVLTIMRSFDYTATAAALLQADFLKVVMATFLFAITSAVEIALPIMGSLFIINFALMLIGKNAPQLNIFMNAAVVKITVGILFIAISVPMFGYVFKNLTETLLEEYTRLFNFFLTK